MPRRQPPKGYYRATEAKKLLNVSDAMIRNYVQKGKIQYFRPPDMKQGYYLKRDVDKLANELGAFLNLEETAPTKFMVATEEDMPACVAITRALFATEGNEARVTPPERYVSWHRKNPKIIYVLKQDDLVIGFVTTLPLKPDSDKLQEILRADLLGEVDITSDDVEEYKPNNRIQLYIAGAGIKPSLDRDSRRIYGSKLIGSFISSIAELGRQGVLIERIVAVGATHSGVRLLQHFGFSEIVPIKPGKRVFILNVKESGAPVSMQYKQALSENGYHL